VQAGAAGEGAASHLARVLQHGEAVQRDVGARPGVGRGREVVGVRLAGHLEDRDGLLRRHLRPAREPLGVGPRLHHGLRDLVAGPGLLFDVVEGVKHENGLLKTGGRRLRELRDVQKIDQRGDVVPALHGPEQLGGVLGRDDRRGRRALGNGTEEACLDVRGLVDAGGHPLGQQLDELLRLLRRGILQQLDQR
jgi:hypothetical protein